MSEFPLQSESRTLYELVPLVPLDDWWQWLIVVLVWVTLASLAIWMYRRDSRQLPRPVAWTLTTLRTATLIGLLVFFLGPQRRSETRIIKPSELLVLIDTSLSMGLSDNPGDQDRRRIDSVVDLFVETPMLNELNRQHRVRVFRFGETARAEEIASSEKQQATVIESAARNPGRNIPAWAGYGLLGFGVLCLAGSTIAGIGGFARPWFDWLVCVGSLTCVVAVAATGLADLANLDPQAANAVLPDSGGSGLDSKPFSGLDRKLTGIDWPTELAPRGTSTRLGDAVIDLVQNQRGRSTAGIVLLTDGRSNQGMPPARAVAAAADANLPIYVVGVGSRRPLQNARVSEIEAPQKVFPGDRFQIKAVIQSFGMSGETARVRLLAGTQPGDDATESVIDEISIELIDDGEPQAIDFPITSQVEASRQYTVHIQPPAGDLDSGDNQRRTTVQVITRKTRVLLMAGGPTRDYQFLRNQLYRDEDIELDVWLQMAGPGADQESDRLLTGFPESAADLQQYDCLVAFDPDWRQLSLSQTRWLEQWISNQAGGLIVIAGPVFTPEWTRRPRGDEAIDLVRQFYPVSFYSQGSAALKLGRFGGIRPFPLEFSREGSTAEFLRLAETATASQQIWDSFPGVYGYYAVNEAKAGADILAWFSDPETAVDGRQPVWLASHFYGAGRVLFQASGEIWRLRDGNVNYFQTYYLNLIRWASQGRLLRESRQGLLLLDRNRCWVGDQIVVRALLNDVAGNPLVASEVQATIAQPGGNSRTIQLQNARDAARPGSFTGQFLAASEGMYEIRLPVPGQPDGQVLRGEVQASIPDLEKMNPQRNDDLLTRIARQTSGLYFPDLAADGTTRQPATPESPTRDLESGRVSLAGSRGLAQRITATDQQTWLPGTPDEPFARRLAAWLTGWLVLTLTSEWILRRLYKLA